MEWRSVNFDWNRARALLVTADEGSLSAAARALGMTQPTLGRQVAALEKELGVVLFERVGRGLELTPSGLDLVEHARAMGEAANRLSLAASGRSDSLEGTVCIATTEVMAAFELPAIVQKLRRLHPGVEIEVVASNDTSDLNRREADIAIRSYRPTQPELIGKKIRSLKARLYASQNYLEMLGNPSAPEHLNEADFIGFNRGSLLIEGLNELGLKLTQKNFPVITESHLVHWELVKQGVGIGVMPESIGDAEPGVERVLPQLPPFDVEIWLVAHRELKTSRRIRTVFDVLASELASPTNRAEF